MTWKRGGSVAVVVESNDGEVLDTEDEVVCVDASFLVIGEILPIAAASLSSLLICAGSLLARSAADRACTWSTARLQLRRSRRSCIELKTRNRVNIYPADALRRLYQARYNFNLYY